MLTLHFLIAVVIVATTQLWPLQAADLIQVHVIYSINKEELLPPNLSTVHLSLSLARPLSIDKRGLVELSCPIQLLDTLKVQPLAFQIHCVRLLWRLVFLFSFL